MALCDFKARNKYVQSSENHSVNNMYISTSKQYQKLKMMMKNDDTENESIIGDYVKPTKATGSN